MNYIGKTFSRRCDVTSGPIDTVLYYFFYRYQFCYHIANLKQIGPKLRKLENRRFSCQFILQNTTGTGSCSHLRIDTKNLLLPLLSIAPVFVLIGPLVVKISTPGQIRNYAYISGTGSASAKIRKTIFTIYILYITCKFQLCSPYSRF